MLERILTKTRNWLQHLVSCRCDSEKPAASGVDAAVPAVADNVCDVVDTSAPVPVASVPAPEIEPVKVQEPPASPQGEGAAAAVAPAPPEPPVEPPRQYTGVLAEADALMQQGQAYPALKIIENFLTAEPEDEDGQLLHGLCLELAGRHEEALLAFEALLAKNPNCLPAQKRQELLASVLRKPAPPPIPTLERPWKTGIPRDAVMQIELATHAFSYRGVLLIKNPFDFALYHTLIWKLKPRTIIEIGSKSGGSALWMGDLLNTYGIDGHIYSLDIVPVKDVSHPRVSFLEADGRNLGQYLQADFLGKIPRPLLVIEDADHTYETSIATLRFFHQWLQEGDYIIVEDGILSDMLCLPDYDSGPHRALKEFLREHATRYEIASEYCDFFGYNFTWCTNGYLKRIA